MSEPILFLPVEVETRELDARLLMAVHAVKAGWQVVIGQQWLMKDNCIHFYPGVFLFKGVNQVQYQWMSGVKQWGHRVATIDEEAMAVANPEFLMRGLFGETIYIADALFMQGQNQADTYAKYHPYVKKKLHITGNQRTDLLTDRFSHAYDDEVANIRQTHGNFFLINTNFGYVNTHWGKPENYVKMLVQAGFVDLKKPEDKKWLDDFHNFEMHNLRSLNRLCRELRNRYPDHKVILRPHPAEDVSRWEKQMAGEERIEVVREGSVAPWILASDMLIHNACTTGIEALLLGHPSVTFCAYSNDAEDMFLGNKVNPRVEQARDLFALIDDRLAHPEKDFYSDYPELFDELKKHYHMDEARSATENMLAALDGLKINADTDGLVKPGKKLWSYLQIEKWRAHQKKRIDISFETFQQRLNDFIEPGQDLDVSEIGESLFHIQAKR